MTEGNDPTETPLTARDGTQLRSDCIDGGQALSWADATKVFELVQDAASNATPIMSEWEETSVLPFTEAHDRRRVEQLEGLRKGMRGDHHTLYTYVVTLSGVPKKGGSWMPPADFYSDLTQSWKSVQNALYNVCSDTEWAWVRFLEPDAHGYPHAHLAVLTADRVSAERFENALGAHCDKSPVGRSDCHVADRSIRYERSFELDRKIGDALDGFLTDRGSERERRFSSLLWSMNVPRITYSEGARSYFEPIEDAFDPEMTEVGQ